MEKLQAQTIYGMTLPEFTKYLSGVMRKTVHEVTDERFEAIESRLDRIETRLDNVEQRLGEIDERLTSLENKFDRLERSHDLMGALVLKHDSKLRNMVSA